MQRCLRPGPARAVPGSGRRYPPQSFCVLSRQICVGSLQTHLLPQGPHGNPSQNGGLNGAAIALVSRAAEDAAPSIKAPVSSTPAEVRPVSTDNAFLILRHLLSARAHFTTQMPVGLPALNSHVHLVPHSHLFRHGKPSHSGRNRFTDSAWGWLNIPTIADATVRIARTTEKISTLRAKRDKDIMRALISRALGYFLQPLDGIAVEKPDPRLLNFAVRTNEKRLGRQAEPVRDCRRRVNFGHNQNSIESVRRNIIRPAQPRHIDRHNSDPASFHRINHRGPGGPVLLTTGTPRRVDKEERPPHVRTVSEHDFFAVEALGTQLRNPCAFLQNHQ